MGLASLCRMPEFIYTVMSCARKAHGDKVILDDVTLSFSRAPRSASGPNGAGKSSVLKIMADWTSRPTVRRG